MAWNHDWISILQYQHLLNLQGEECFVRVGANILKAKVSQIFFRFFFFLMEMAIGTLIPWIPHNGKGKHKLKKSILRIQSDLMNMRRPINGREDSFFCYYQNHQTKFLWQTFAIEYCFELKTCFDFCGNFVDSLLDSWHVYFLFTNNDRKLFEIS